MVHFIIMGRLTKAWLYTGEGSSMSTRVCVIGQYYVICCMITTVIIIIVLWNLLGTVPFGTSF